MQSQRQIDWASWSFDEKSGHLAHATGLYTYLTNLQSSSHTLACLGPYSAYTHRLSQAHVTTLICEATKFAEKQYPGAYCLWGSLTKKDVQAGPGVYLLDDVYRFIANPSLRTSALIKENADDLQQLIQREWQVSYSNMIVEHKLGIRFDFHNVLPHKVHCNVSYLRGFDKDVLCKDLLDVSLSALASAGLCLLTIDDEKIAIDHRRKIEMRVSI